MSVGENIRRIRLEKGITQKELGEKSGINPAQIRRYELGGKNSNPKLETIQKIADALEVSIADIDSRQSTPILHELVNEILAKEANYNTIGHRIKIRRESLNLSQKDLADMIDVPEEAISKYESDPQEDIPLIIIKKIAKKLRVSNNYIIWGSDDYPYIYPDLENFLNSLDWGVQVYVPCSQNDNCPLTDEDKESLLMGFYQKKCKNCPNNRIDYIIYNTRKSYLLSEQEYDDLESCILPYLKLRLNECLNKKKPLSKKDLENMGLGWIADP